VEVRDLKPPNVIQSGGLELVKYLSVYLLI